ncbi:MAG TPA: hypothetical protein VN931_03260 [Fibrobacteria bacterium]|nr:hypothetical protein [Fibrobacteria bacterium]
MFLLLAAVVPVGASEALLQDTVAMDSTGATIPVRDAPSEPQAFDSNGGGGLELGGWWYPNLGRLFEIGGVGSKPSGLSFGGTFEVGDPGSSQKSAYVCGTYGCSDEEYQKVLWALDLLTGWSERGFLSDHLGLRLLAGISGNFLSESIDDCEDCSSYNHYSLGLVIRPEAVLYMPLRDSQPGGGSAADWLLILSPRLDVGSPKPGWSFGVQLGVHTR